ncbi:hypothetical protein [Anaeromyxobacter oryzae]|uniref:Uncharacterized protein n=1 Tax=Anaeromyxobacter oryzae TaxID=2918170 RepID=A0ABN6MNQ4_9BACT|nr:hypothetical protein [Anaeromyxobacter oryzae]BDG02659.1 hypothetical protein AMOR_16550 [Anaeromyxobacter oryzae]
MRGVRAERRAARGAPRARAFAAWLLVVGGLLVTWPFVRVPALPLVHAWVHLLGAWVVVIFALVALSLALGRRAKDRDDG